MVRPVLLQARERRALRRQVFVPCQVVDEPSFRLAGDFIFDLSPYGACVRCVHPLALGSEAIISFRIPQSSLYYDAEARVARVLWGRREGDTFPALGLRFTRVDPVAQIVLETRLRGLPPPIPRRRLRPDYAASVMAIRNARPPLAA